MLAGIEDNQSPPVTAESCRSMGKECRDCISSSASVVALLCPSLDAAAAQQTFFRMYRHEGCVNMSRAFVREYLSAIPPGTDTGVTDGGLFRSWLPTVRPAITPTAPPITTSLNQCRRAGNRDAATYEANK